jgi:hypothetical protein
LNDAILNVLNKLNCLNGLNGLNNSQDSVWRSIRAGHLPAIALIDSSAQLSRLLSQLLFGDRAGLGLGACLGWHATGSWVGALSTMFIVAVLAILEVSLSFDNDVVNAMC